VKKDAARAIKRFESLGYKFDRATAGRLVYRHVDGHEVLISENAGERDARRLVREVEERRGAVAAANKRNSQKIKERTRSTAQAESDERERLRARTEAILAAKTEALSRQSSLAYSSAEWRDIARQIEQFDREASDLRRLMQPSAPRERVAAHRNGKAFA
jgi:hypothetical protein